MDGIKYFLESKLPNYQQYALYMVWFAGVGALIGSMAFSEIMNLIPCKLCWWERIFMYSIPFIATVGILRKDVKFVYYVFPLSVLGAVISGYHSLLQWGVIKEAVINCSLDGAVSCADPQINWFGFITIPFMAFVTFLAIIFFSWLSIPPAKKK